MTNEHLVTDLEIHNVNNLLMYNNFGIKFLYINHNYKPNSKDYDERGLGVHLIKGQLYAVVQRPYF